MLMPTPALHPPDNPAAMTAWLAWLDANRLTPAAARALTDVLLPEDVRAHLDAAYVQARARWLLHKTALRRFLALMAQKPAQPVILLKGAALAFALYDDPAIRPMNDIDLLVGPDNLMTVVQRMRASGYEERSLGAGNDVGYLHHFVFIEPHTGVRFELHRTLPLLPSDAGALSWFLTQTQLHRSDNLCFRTFTPGAQLLHLASHAVLEHGGAESALGIWFYDIDQLMRRWGDGVHWDEILAQSQKLAWEAALHEAIRLAQSDFATPAPPAIRAWLQLPQRELSGYNTMRQMTSTVRSSSLTIFHILRGLTWRQRGQQLLAMFFPGRGYMTARYPALPWPVAYPYRWFSAARKLLPALFHK